MADVIPIRGHFESPSLMLHSLAQDENIAGFAIVVRRKDGFLGRAQYDMSRGQMALASLVLGQWALEVGEELEG